MDNPKKILIVEDEPDMQQMVQMRLEAAGYKVITANNGQEGLAKVNEELPDLIISDVLMPVMDGFTFYKELKAKKATEDIPVLILTARGKMEDSFKVMGADDFIAKPFNAQDFLHTCILGFDGDVDGDIIDAEIVIQIMPEFAVQSRQNKGLALQ